MVVVVADEVGLDGLDEPLHVLPVSQDCFVVRADTGEVGRVTDLGPLGSLGADPKLLFVGVGGIQIYVGEMDGVALAQVGHQIAEAGERSRARLVRQEVGFERRMFLHPLDQGIQPGALDGVIQHLRFEQVTRQHGPQVVPGGHVQALRRHPGQVVALGRCPGQGFISGRRRAPKGDDEFSLLPATRRSSRCAGNVGTQASKQKRSDCRLFTRHSA